LNGEWQFHAKSRELIDAFWLVLLTEHEVVRALLRAEGSLQLRVVAGQLYRSFGFSLADYRWFQVSNLSREIHSTAFVHHTVLTDRDF